MSRFNRDAGASAPSGNAPATREPVEQQESDVVLKPQEMGTIEGEYLGAKAGTNKQGRDYTIYTVGSTKFWGTAMLNKLLENVEEGTNIRLTYEGKVSVQYKAGARPTHMFKLEKI